MSALDSIAKWVGLGGDDASTTGGGLPAATPDAATPDLAAQAQKIQAAIAKLQSNQLNDPMPYAMMAAGFGAPTKSGSFFESLGNMNANLGNYMMQKRQQDLTGLQAQASLLGMQADLPLKQMQTKMLERQVKGLGQAGDIMAGRSAVTPTAAAPSATADGGSSSLAPSDATGGGSSPPDPTAYKPGDPITGDPKLQTAVSNFSRGTGLTPAVDILGNLLKGQKLIEVGTAANLPHVVEAGKTLYSEANSMIAKGIMPVVGQDGAVGIVPMPGYLQKLYGEHYAQASAEWAGKGRQEKGAELNNQLTIKEFEARTTPATGFDKDGNPISTSRWDLATGKAGLTPELGGQDKPILESEGKWFGALPDSIASKEQTLTRLKAMADAWKTVQSGIGSNTKAEIQGYLRTILGPDAAKAIDPTDRAQVQIALKNAMQESIAGFRDLPSGSRMTQMEWQAMKNEGMANNSMEPEANHAIIGQMMGIVKNDLDMERAALAAKAQSGNRRLNLGTFASDWYKNNPYSASIAAAKKDLGDFKGMGNNQGAQNPTDLSAIARAAAEEQARRRAAGGAQ